MNINYLNSTAKTPSAYYKNNKIQKNRTEKTSLNNTKFSSSNILAQYNKAAVSFGQKFDSKTLEDKKSTNVFLPEELMNKSRSINIQSAIELGYPTTKAEVCHLEKHGELIPYKIRQYLEDCQSMGLSEEETKQYLEQKTTEFQERISRLKQEVIDVIDELSPTVREHVVYRTDNPGYEDYQREYFSNLVSFEEGDEVSLGQFPVYVSTSEKRVMDNYGPADNRDCVLFKIILPQGSKLIKMPSGDGIHQCIMKPDSRFEVVENKEFDDNFHYITLKYLP